MSAALSVDDTIGVNRLRSVVPWLARSVAAISVIVLVGWATDTSALKSVFPGLTSMKVNTAIELLLLSIGLFALQHRHAAPLWAAVAIVAILGSLTLAEYLFEIDLHIDNFLFIDRDRLLYPGRNAPATIWSCFAVGTAYLLLNQQRWLGIAQAILLLTLVVPLTTFGGYLYRAPGMYLSVPYPVLALHTAISITLLCLGGLLAAPQAGLMCVVTSRSVAGRVSRRLLPLSILLPMLAGLAVLVGERAEIYTIPFGSALLVSFCAVLFATAVWWTATLLWRTEQAGAGAESERRRAEVALAESEAEFRQLANTIPQLAWMARPDGYLFWYNQRWYEYTGTTLEKMAGSGWRDVHDPAHLPKVAEQWSRSIETGEPLDMEFPLKSADGNYRWFLTRVEPLKDASGQIRLWFGTNTDIEDKRRVNEERILLLQREQAARAEAEAANKAKDQFLAVLSHELRTPLTPVLATVTYFESFANLPDELRAELGTIRRNVELEARLVDDLLDMTRISRGKIELHFEAIDMHRLAKNACQMVGSEAAGKGLTLTLALDAARHHCWADPTRIQQVLVNLIQNAIRFTPENGGGVTVRTANEKELLRVEVADHGIGFNPAIAEKLFDAFEQVERTVTRGKGGLGLGLSIGKSFAEMHGGSLAGRSDGKSKGATFTLTLATMAEAVTKAPEITPLPSPSVPLSTAQACSVLLVEDHDDTRRVMARLLKSFGCSVKTAGTVAEALDLAGRGPIDLLLSDIGLPDGTGHDVMRYAKQKGIRGVALSGFGKEEDIRQSYESGFEMHLVKPVNFQELESVILGVAAAR